MTSGVGEDGHEMVWIGVVLDGSVEGHAVPFDGDGSGDGVVGIAAASNVVSCNATIVVATADAGCSVSNPRGRSEEC